MKSNYINSSSFLRHSIIRSIYNTPFYSVAIIKNVKSQKMGKKDILKIDQDIDINLDVLGYIDPDISVNIIRDGKLVEKKNIELPERLVGIKKCTNPRCITSTEQGIQHIFKLTDRAHRIYRCIYCEADK